jgi:hypothetical protein
MRVLLGAEVVQQSRGSLDIGEEESDGAARQTVHERIMRCAHDLT